MKPIYIDFIVLLFTILSFVHGWKKGFIQLIFRAVGYIGGGILGLILARDYSMHHKLPFDATLFFILALIVGALIGDALAAGLANLLHKNLLPKTFAQLDSVLGGLVGAARSLVAFAIAITVLLATTSGTLHYCLAASKSYHLLHKFSPKIVSTALHEAKKIK